MHAYSAVLNFVLFQVVMNGNSKTVFVKGVSFDVNEEALAEYFSAVGPVHRATLVKRSRDGSHKGFGYVEYAMEQDANLAIEQFSGKELKGRTLAVEISTTNGPTEPRPKPNKRKQGGLEQPMSKRPKETSSTTTTNQHRFLRTVAISAANLGLLKCAIEEAKRVGTVEEVILGVDDTTLKKYKLTDDGCSGETALIVFKNVGVALQAVAALHGKSISHARTKGGASKLWARQVSGEGLHLKRWRVIVRNLRFTVSEEDLRNAFQAAGCIWEVTIPRGPDGRSKGFAFIGFTCRAHAERAIVTANGSTIAGRLVAVDWAVSKAQYTALLEEPSRAGKVASPEENGHSKPSMKEKVVTMMGRESNEEEMDIAPEQERKLVLNVLEDILAGDEEKEQMNKNKKADENEGDAVDKEKDEGGEDNLKQARPAEVGATVFIRGLPLDIVKEQVFQKMKVYGPVKSCRLVVDKTTDKLRGTAFVDYYHATSAEKAAASCDKWREKQGAGIIIAGRPVECDVAVDANTARKLSAAASENGKGDRRNVHLAKEGVLVEGSEDWLQLSASDKAKRKRGQEDKKTKLASPNFAVSRTRLSVRNIPVTWTEKQLKQTFIKAVKQRATKANPKVVQAKILVDDEKVDSQGNAKSRGIGFVEFAEHEHALCALRQLNNSPTVWGKDRRPIIEFAIDNVKALKAREAKLALSKKPGSSVAEKPAGVYRKSDESVEPPEEEEAPKSKRTLRKERRQMLKERQAAGKSEIVPAGGGKSCRRREQRKKRNADPRELDKNVPAETCARQAENGAQHVKAAVKRARVEEALDTLAQLPESSLGTLKKPPKKSIEKKDKLDALVSNFKSRYFDADTRQKNPPQSVKRWFDV